MKGNYISFGVNRSGHLIMWLGDIDTLPREEQLHLASKNICSDHDIGSEFYAGQIEVEFTQPTREQRIIQSLGRVSTAIFERYEIKLLKLDDEALPLIKSLRRPLHFSEREMSESIECLNKLLVERLNTSALKEQLKSRMAPKRFEVVKSLGGLKTFELWLPEVAGVTHASALIAPMFVIYDLRVVLKHLTSKTDRVDTLNKCLERLGLPVGADNEQIYDALTSALLGCYDNLLTRIASAMSASRRAHVL